ncbi:hypothetical protein PMAYCL1PPCAC_01312 [Pristionchus mayeri]|uniref:Endophilin-B1 n=1 Tax=Pristionchus mayeri TaxID=1317129 RepID=A0AAN4YY74_9BILA|nr:hypothetical protein PMAYCL1PPCAC_01312 [Pristionchus mayeri]
MDFNFKKLASDATGLFNRAKQYTEETFLKGEKTELDPHFEALLQRADKTEDHTRRLLSCIESYLQPNPTVRMEDVFYEKLELRKEGSRMNNLESLATAMCEAGEEFGAATPYGSALLKVAATQQKLGQHERELVGQAAQQTLLPIKRFLDGDMKTIQKERKVLHAKRLDLDACKSRLRKAKQADGIQAGGSKPVGGLTIEQAEAEVRVAQAEFDKQTEITKLLLEGIQTAHNNQLKCIRDFVEAQLSFYAQAHQSLADLQRDLSGTLVIRGATVTTTVVERAANGEKKKSLTGIYAALSDGGTKQARVIMDYDAVLRDELSVRLNEVIIVYRLPGMDEDFVMAERAGVRGRIPIEYIEIV